MATMKERRDAVRERLGYNERTRADVLYRSAMTWSMLAAVATLVALPFDLEWLAALSATVVAVTWGKWSEEA